MAYIGKVPTAVPLTSADLQDNIITSAKISDGTITASDLDLTDNYDFTGTVTGAGESNKPMFKVSGGNTTMNDRTTTKFTPSSEIFDSDNCYDLGGNNRFTPTKAGKYLFTGRVQIQSSTNTDYFIVQLFKNGSNQGGVAIFQTDYQVAHFTILSEANGSSDYFELYGEQQSGVSLIGNLNEFSGFYIGN